MNSENTIYCKTIYIVIQLLIFSFFGLAVVDSTAEAEDLQRKRTKTAVKKEISGRYTRKDVSDTIAEKNAGKKSELSTEKSDNSELRTKRKRKSQKSTVSRKKEIDNIIPRKKSGLSAFNAMGLDVLIPGGGHFYTNSYSRGMFFATIKIAGAYSMYYFYREWRYFQSQYQDSKRDAGSDTNTVEESQWEYDRSVQKLTLAIIVNVAIYVVSCTVLYHSVKDYNQRTIPTFDVNYSSVKRDGVSEGLMQAMYSIRI